MYVQIMDLGADTEPQTHILISIRANYSTDTCSASVTTFLVIGLRLLFLEFNQPDNVFNCFLTVQYLIIYYIPTNCTNLLFIYKQHIKTFLLFKLLKLLLHVSVTD